MPFCVGNDTSHKEIRKKCKFLQFSPNIACPKRAWPISRKGKVWGLWNRDPPHIMWVLRTFWGTCRALYLFLKQSYMYFKFSGTRNSKSCKKSGCPLSLGCKLFFVCSLDLMWQLSGKMGFLWNSSPKYALYARMHWTIRARAKIRICQPWIENWGILSRTETVVFKDLIKILI